MENESPHPNERWHQPQLRHHEVSLRSVNGYDTKQNYFKFLKMLTICGQAVSKLFRLNQNSTVAMIVDGVCKAEALDIINGCRDAQSWPIVLNACHVHIL